MTEAEALDRALPLLRGKLDPVAIRVLAERRRALDNLCFSRVLLEDGDASYLLGDPADPIAYRPPQAHASCVLALHTLIATGELHAADWSDARDPVEAVRKLLRRALDAVYAVNRELADGIGPSFDSSAGVFRWHRSDRRQRIITDAPLARVAAPLAAVR